MKHIVILVDQLYCAGGIERLVVLKANYWTSIFNYKVTIISTEQKNHSYAYPLSDKVQFIDLAIDYDRKKSYFKTSNLLRFFRNIRVLKKELVILQADFIIVASHIPMTYAINFIKGRAKTLKEFHFTMFDKQNNWKSTIENFFYKKYDFLAILSQEEALFYPTKNTVVLPNPLIELEADKRNRSEKMNKAIFLGRIVPVKNLEGLIEIWNGFIKNNSDWILEIYGDADNDYGTALKNKIISMELKDTIIFKGETRNTIEAINQCKIMLLTSHQECFPLVILESLSQGVPVFSYDCPTGPRNILTDGYDGRLIENKNSSKFVSALEQFAREEQMQIKLSENCFITAERYSLENIMELWNNTIFKNDSI